MKAWEFTSGAGVVLACLALVSSAVAKPGYFVSPAYDFAEMHLKSTNEYEIAISTVGDDELSLRVEKDSASGQSGAFARGSTSAQYVVRHVRAGLRRIDAKLPGLGRVSVRFEQIGPTRHGGAADCPKEIDSLRFGVFRGTIRFRGEHGYTRVATSSARGLISESPRAVCRKNSSIHSRTPDHFQFLSASSSLGYKPSLFIASISNDGQTGANFAAFQASIFARKGPVLAFKTVSATTDVETGAFSIEPGPNGKPSAATVEPPSPFGGTATFAQQPDSSWTLTGTLSAEFPGIGPVPLAGPGFTAEACIERRCSGRDGDRHATSTVGRPR